MATDPTRALMVLSISVRHQCHTSSTEQRRSSDPGSQSKPIKTTGNDSVPNSFAARACQQRRHDAISRHLGAPVSHQAIRIGPDHANPSTCSRKLCVRSNAKWPVLALFDMCPERANRAIRSMTRLHIHLSCQQSPSSKECLQPPQATHYVIPSGVRRNIRFLASNKSYSMI
ncbi:hypothetical protein K456DRAFT_540374 [Colletotrichum gloeosporioides 23]|nr:hypothetical protein K456DRAFT_540374 [Colletotrichum gloeosporioides 23]